VCKVNAGGTACADSDAICAILGTVTVTSDYDCDIRSKPDLCYNNAGACTPNPAACTDYTFTGSTADAKATSC
jgi:hypothetical protein